MEQLVIDIRSDEDASLIKELLKRFKTVEITSFSSGISKKEMNARIQKGISDADNGNTRPWKDIKKGLLKKVSNSR